MKILKLFTLFLILTGCSNKPVKIDYTIPDAADFVTIIYIIKQEKSKDSHSDSYYIKIKNKKLEYLYNHRGFPEEINRSFRTKIKKPIFRKLIKYIKSNSLNINLKENKPAGNIGLSFYMTVKIKLKNKITEISISGMLNDWGKNKLKKNPCNVKNIKYYYLAFRIISGFKNNRLYF